MEKENLAPAKVPENIILLGGSFNPVHNGHLRLALEVYEAASLLAPSRLDFIPCANPPHKAQGSLLPFELRVEILQRVCKKNPGFHVNPLEGERAGASYTCDTLDEYHRRYPDTKLFFVLGAEDFMYLDSWKNWQQLPEQAGLLIVARKEFTAGKFSTAVKRLWPRATEEENYFQVIASNNSEILNTEGLRQVTTAFRTPGGGRIFYLPVTRIDIDASMLRRLWCAGRSVDFLTPEEVIVLLTEHSALIKEYWS